MISKALKIKDFRMDTNVANVNDKKNCISIALQSKQTLLLHVGSYFQKPFSLILPTDYHVSFSNTITDQIWKSDIFMGGNPGHILKSVSTNLLHQFQTNDKLSASLARQNSRST